MKKTVIIYKAFIYSILLLFTLFCIVVATFQTDWCRKNFRSFLIKEAKKRQIVLTIDKMEGLLPLYYRLSDISLELEDRKIKIKRLNCQLAFFPLFKGQLTFKTFNAQGVTLLDDRKIIDNKKNVDISSHQERWISLPFTVYFKSLKIENFHFHTPSYPTDIILSMTGKAKITKKGKIIFFNIKALREDFKNSHFKILVLARKKDSSVKTKLTANVKTTKALLPYLHLPIEAKLRSSIDIQGSWKSYKNLIFQRKPLLEDAPLYGKIEAKLHDIDEKDNPLDILLENSRILSNFTINPDLSYSLSNLQCESNFLFLKGNLTWNRDIQIKNGEISLQAPNLALLNSISPLDIKGNLKLQLLLTSQKDKTFSSAIFNIDSFYLQNEPIPQFQGKITSQIDRSKIEGSLEMLTTALGEKIDGKTNFSWQPKIDLLLTYLILKSPTFNIFAHLKIPSFSLILGKVTAKFKNFSPFKRFLYSYELKGIFDLSANFKKGKKGQDLDVAINFSQFFIDRYCGEKGKVTLQMFDLFENPQGNLLLNLTNTRLNRLLIDSLVIETSNLQENWPFHIEGKGTLKELFEISSSGFWKVKDKEIFVNLQDFKGNFFKHSFTMPIPTNIEFTKKHISLTDFEMILADSSLKANIYLAKDTANLHLSLDHFPLDFFSINPLDIDFLGLATMEAQFSKKEDLVDGNLNLKLEKVEIHEIGKEKPLQASGKIEADIKNNRLISQASMEVGEKKALQAKVDLPINISTLPFKMEIDPNSPLSADINTDGRIEEIFDFFDLGSHRLQGKVVGNISISQTLFDPKIKGSLQLKNGIYENYYTGTYFKEITGEISAVDHSLNLISLSGKDDKEGSFFATGNIDLLAKENFPFTFDTQFSDLIGIKSDLIEAVANGKVKIAGDKISAKVSGDLSLKKVDMSIPEKLPVTIPTIDVIYLNQSEDQKDLTLTKGKKIFPLHLDLNIAAPSHVYITGRGISSEWKGNFKVEGTYGDIIAKGNLHLIKGNFIFSGRSFDLTEGNVTLSGKPRSLPHLSISGKISQYGTTIIANLKGPLDAPNLTFQSIPPLPISSIISFLLFGRDISEISGIQAIQLAATVASLSEGPDILEATRKGLGVDRLAIVSTPTTNVDEPDQIALQVGKYITRGVMVTISQGPQQGSTNVIMEVDLTHGFILQAETQQQEEQGKFSLKWNLNY